LFFSLPESGKYAVAISKLVTLLEFDVTIFRRNAKNIVVSPIMPPLIISQPLCITILPLHGRLGVYTIVLPTRPLRVHSKFAARPTHNVKLGAAPPIKKKPIESQYHGETNDSEPHESNASSSNTNYCQCPESFGHGSSSPWL
jgi:hypothetical protein